MKKRKEILEKTKARQISGEVKSVEKMIPASQAIDSLLLKLKIAGLEKQDKKILLEVARKQIDSYAELLSNKKVRRIIIGGPSDKKAVLTAGFSRHPPYDFFNPKSIEVIGRLGKTEDIKKLEAIKRGCGEAGKERDSLDAIKEIKKRVKKKT